MRKKLFIFSFLFIAFGVGMMGCKLSGKSNYTPELKLVNPAKLNKDSALQMSYTNEGNVRLDSLHVNDTVMIWLVGQGFTNNLTRLDIKAVEKGDIQLIQPHDSITRYFASTSDFTDGKILFPENIGAMGYPFEFVALKPRDKVKVLLSLTSSAQEVANIATIQLEFPIKSAL